MSKQGIYSTYLDIPRPNSQRNFKPNGAVLNHFSWRKKKKIIYIYIYVYCCFCCHRLQIKQQPQQPGEKASDFPPGQNGKQTSDASKKIETLGAISVFSRLQKWMKRPSVPRRGHEGVLVLSSFLYQVLHVYSVDCEFWYICKAS